MFKFIHAADIHLDSPLRGLSRYEGAPVEEIRGASRKALQNLVQLAVNEEVRFIVFSGDVFDGDWRDYNTGLFFVRQMIRLRQAGIRVFMAAGNHDAQSQISRSLKLPDNVYRFSTRAFQTEKIEEINVAVHGRGFPNRVVSEDWVPGYPPPARGTFNIGVLHTSVGGYASHETYAPCSLSSLINKGYDYWALGHVHKRETLNESPWVVFPGNIQGRHVREEGPKGAMLIFVENDEVREVTFQDLDVVRWKNLVISSELEDDGDDIYEKVRENLSEAISGADGRILAIRITVAGTCAAHSVFMKNPEKWRSQFRSAAMDIGQGDIWLEKVLFRTASPARLAEEEIDALRSMIGYVREKEQQEETLTKWGAEKLKGLREKLPPELFIAEDGFSIENPDWLRQSLREGLDNLISNITTQGDKVDGR